MQIFNCTMKAQNLTNQCDPLLDCATCRKKELKKELKLILLYTTNFVIAFLTLTEEMWYKLHVLRH